MLFSSVIFIFYFLPIVLGLYYALSFSRKLQNGLLLISSLFFYAFGESKYVLLMIASILGNYFFGLLVDKYREKGKFILVLTCIFNLGILFVFKYLNFVIRNVNDLLAKDFTTFNIILPIGISFFTFQALSYVVDVYRKDAEVQKNPLYLGLYISFFPQLIAGPIVRYTTIEDQILNRKENFTLFSNGVCRFISGMAKKVLLSNCMAIVVDRAFQLNEMYSGLPVSLAWLGSIAYTFQIYYDFSGYSDMAIGLGQMFGFKFLENFNFPYVSKSISEFWRRWHISLGTWFKDYVYFPLGGSRVKNKDRIIINLLVVWFLTGVWHGAEWTFIIWGLLNFVFIALEKIISFEDLNIKPVFKHIYALFLINLGWVIFRSTDLVEAGNYISSMFGFKNLGFASDYTLMFIKENLVFFIAAIIFAMPITKRANLFLAEGNKKFVKTFNIAYPLVMMLIFMICVCYLVKGTYNPFIYFNF